MRVLVVDDDPDIRALLRLGLGSEFDLVTAAGGGDGLTTLRSGGPFDILILDVQMPECDGWTVLETVRAEAAMADPAVIMLTVKAHQRDVERAMRLGCDHYITKPFDVFDLCRRMHDLGRRQAGADRS